MDYMNIKTKLKKVQQQQTFIGIKELMDHILQIILAENKHHVYN